MEDEIRHFCHKHRLKLNESHKFNANCAAWILSGFVCSFNDCRYYLHKECAKLEDEIEHFLHPFHSLKLRELEGERAFFCSVCHKLCRGFTYHCRRCNFKIDLQCALKTEREMENETQHFSHKHRLKLNESYKFNANCAAWILSGFVYSCNDCRYYLHKECAKLEDKIEHFHRSFHSLMLLKLKGEGAFFCSVCHKLCRGFTYHCRRCNFKIDLQCALESEIWFPIHDHSLKLQVSDTDTEPSFFCDFCHTRCYSHRGRSLHCKEDCNFKIDLDCARMLRNSEFEPIQHVSHEHWLIYNDCIKAWDRKYCAACREVCDGATYCCKPCYFFLHASCAMYTTEIKLSLHSDHPLMLSTRKEREHCDFCNLTCQALTFRCDLCNFKIDYLCALMLIQVPRLIKIDHFSHPHSLLLNYRISHSGNGSANCYACRKQLLSPIPFYKCSDCAFYLHHSCGVDLIKHYRDYKHILNSFHNHPLEIVYYDRKVPGVVCCTLCHKCCFGPTYVCFLCKFFLHQSCLELLGTNTISQNSFHKHPLIIAENKVNDSTSSFFMNNDFPSCSACGEPCFKKSFACLKCKFLIHEFCLQLPHEIQHFFHPCPLSLQRETTNFTCRACEKSDSLFAYHCNSCHFFLDVKCALMFTENFEGQNYILSYNHHHPLILYNKESDDHVLSCDECNKVISSEIYGCIECDFRLHRSCAAVPHQIEHPFHPKHTLSFVGKLLCTVSILKSLDKKGKVKYLRHKHFSIHDEEENEVCCGVCEKHVCDPSYKCIRCKFFIHQDCIEPVEELQHPLQPHDNDSLIGVSRRTLPRKKFTCDACSCKSCVGFSYCCEECSFKLDANCASLKPSIKYKDHEHLLTFFKKVYDDPQCEVCKSCHPDVSYLRCVECDFNVHLLCAPLPSTIKHKCHIDPLYLDDYFVEDDSGEYYCDACENSREPQECVYRCEGCANYVAHINCVIDEVLLSLSGLRGNVKFVSVDRKRVDKLLKRGLTLEYIFSFSDEEERKEFEGIEALVGDLIGEIMSKAKSRNMEDILENSYSYSDEKFILLLKNVKFYAEDLRKKIEKYTKSFQDHISDKSFQDHISDEYSEMKTEEYTASFQDHISDEHLRKMMDDYTAIFQDHISDEHLQMKIELYTASVKEYIYELENAKLDVRDSGMTFWDLESEVVKVGDYMVSRNFELILKSLIEKFGDFSADSTLNLRTKTRFINIFSGVAHSMCNTEVTTDLLFNWWKNFMLVQHAGFKIQFAFDNLYRLAQSWFCLHREFVTNETLLNYHVQIRDLKTKFEELKVLKVEQKQCVASTKRKSLQEKERLIADIELISNTPRTLSKLDEWSVIV